MNHYSPLQLKAPNAVFAVLQRLILQLSNRQGHPSFWPWQFGFHKPGSMPYSPYPRPAVDGAFWVLFDTTCFSLLTIPLDRHKNTQPCGYQHYYYQRMLSVSLSSKWERCRSGSLRNPTCGVVLVVFNEIGYRVEVVPLSEVELALLIRTNVVVSACMSYIAWRPETKEKHFRSRTWQFRCQHGVWQSSREKITCYLLIKQVQQNLISPRVARNQIWILHKDIYMSLQAQVSQ